MYPPGSIISADLAAVLLGVKVQLGLMRTEFLHGASWLALVVTGPRVKDGGTHLAKKFYKMKNNEYTQ